MEATASDRYMVCVGGGGGEGGSIGRRGVRQIRPKTSVFVYD